MADEDELTIPLEAAVTPAPIPTQLAAPAPKQLYECNGCSNKIPDHRARILCHNCTDYHLCTNCYLIKQYTRPHVDFHPTMIHKKSGFFVLDAFGFTPRPPPALPPPSKSNPASQQNIRDIEVPTADWSVLWNLVKGPLRKKSQKVAPKDITPPQPIDLIDMTGMGMSGANGAGTLPPSPPHSVDPDGSAPAYPMPAKWEPLFAADSTPTPIFISLMSTIFSCLDPLHTGYLDPETYSMFLDTQGYQWNASVWKNALASEAGENHKDVADLEFSIYLADLSIPHKLGVRSKSTPPPETYAELKSPVEARVKNHIKLDANMPMLSRQSFIDLSAIEYLVSPTKAHEYLQKALSEYGVWTDLGELPRNVLPKISLHKASQIKYTAPKKDESEDKETGGLTLPIRLNGGAKKVQALMEKEEFHEVDLTQTSQKSE
ncbi:hypothetical protein BJ875DRAFT_466276 [Amylocarpus encephaloides]|uniref:ZZ-type domain-containing protein n=1 Tax=Amylocarpus encephaloides TaxID=45428 RepID=A0A9P8C3Z7_9HELO|nr:hypothetical protein BJ875DRAFT_466276 [Amylocarpus encephaloides]